MREPSCACKSRKSIVACNMTRLVIAGLAAMCIFTEVVVRRVDVFLALVKLRPGRLRVAFDLERHAADPLINFTMPVQTKA